MFRIAFAALTALTLSACQSTTNSPEDTAAFIEAGIETQEFFADSVAGILTRCERYFRSGSIPSPAQLAREGYRPIRDENIEVEVYAKPPPGADAVSTLNAPSISFQTRPETGVRTCVLLTPPAADSRWIQIFVVRHFEERGYEALPRRNNRAPLILRKGTRYVGFNGATDRRGVSLSVIESLAERDIQRMIAAALR